jgi:hypothetical protein
VVWSPLDHLLYTPGQREREREREEGRKKMSVKGAKKGRIRS